MGASAVGTRFSAADESERQVAASAPRGQAGRRVHLGNRWVVHLSRRQTLRGQVQGLDRRRLRYGRGRIAQRDQAQRRLLRWVDVEQAH